MYCLQGQCIYGETSYSLQVSDVYKILKNRRKTTLLSIALMADSFISILFGKLTIFRFQILQSTTECHAGEHKGQTLSTGQSKT